MFPTSAGAKAEAETDRREGSGEHLSHKELGVNCGGCAGGTRGLVFRGSKCSSLAV